jgi:hypothetical protein
LNYTNNLGEDAVVVFLFVSNTTSNVVASSTVQAPMGGGIVGTLFYCSNYPADQYNVVWRAFRKSDTSLTNPVASSNSKETQTFSCANQPPVIKTFACSAIGSLKAQCSLSFGGLDSNKKYFVYVAGNGKTNSKPAVGATTISGTDSSATVIILTLLTDNYQLGAWVFDGTNPDIVRTALTFWKGIPVEVQIT